MEDSWLDDLQALHDADQAQREAKEAAKQKAKSLVEQRKEQARAIMNRLHAHELLRQLQKTLLKGNGELTFYQNTQEYDEVVTLVWCGSFSAARKPKIDEVPEGNLVVAARGGQAWLNGVAIEIHTPDYLQKMLLAACRQWQIEYQKAQA